MERSPNAKVATFVDHSRKPAAIGRRLSKIQLAFDQSRNPACGSGYSKSNWIFKFIILIILITCFNLYENENKHILWDGGK